MFSIGQEQLIDVNEAAKHMTCHPKTVYIHMQPFDRDGNPKRYLESTKLGRKRLTTLAAINRFQRPVEYERQVYRQTPDAGRQRAAEQKFKERFGE